MGILSGVNEFFGLDIGTSAIRIVQLRNSGSVKSLVRYGSIDIDSNIALSESKADQQKLAQIIRQLVRDAGITTTNVAVGIPSSKVFTTVEDFDRLSNSELEKSIRFQADSLIPIPINEAKIDWALLGDSPKDHTKIEVLLTSVPNEYVEARLDLLESIGLNVIAFEPDNIALARSMIASEATMPQMVIDIGSKSSDIVIVMNGAPRLTRSIPTGSDAIVRAAMQNLSIDETQAQQFVFKFGLSQDKLEGQIYNAILGTIEIIMSDIEKSIKFFQTRQENATLDRVIVTGGASALPEFPLYMANKLGLNVEIGSSWRNVAFPTERQNELIAVSNHFGVAAGLAERNE